MVTPTATAVTVPLAFTLATASSSLLQVTLLVTLSVAVMLATSEAVPPTASCNSAGETETLVTPGGGGPTGARATRCEPD